MLPPIVVKDELEIEADALPEIVETFYAVTMERRFPNPVVRSLLDANTPSDP